MINFFKALSIILNSVENKHNLLKKNYTNLYKSINTVSSDNIFSNKNIPSFKSSAMDGYAINMENIKKRKKILYFRITEKVYAGNFFEKTKILNNEAIEIMTGARVPSKFNVVIKYEDILKKKKFGFFVNKDFKIFENIKLIGDDIKIGDKIVGAGTSINISEITVLSTIGIEKIKIFKYPDIYLISTGNEILDKKNEQDTLSISNSSKAYISSFLKSINIKLKDTTTVKDNIKQFINKIKKIWSTNNISIFLTTGAVSKGKSDFIPLVLKLVGIKVIFHSVNIKPGKPILFGKFKNFTYFFCLPGNPVSTIIGIRFFLYTFLMSLLGQNLEEPIMMNIKNEFKTKKDTFLKSFSYFKNNRIINLISNDQESFKVKPLLKTNSFTFVKKNENKRYIYLNNIKNYDKNKN